MRGWSVPVLAGIFFVALGLRFWNIGFGLPAWYHPDEPVKVRDVVRIAEGDPAPSRFYHPSFMLYAAAITLRGAGVFGYPVDDRSAVLAGRFNSAVLGAGTVLWSFLLARACAGSLAGIAAALLLAVAPLHVVCSHYLKEDVAMTFWGTASLLFAVRFARDGHRRDALLSSLLAGICAGTKYTGIVFSAFPYLAARMYRRSRPSAALQVPRVAPLLALTGFLATTPFSLLHPFEFVLGVGHSGARVAGGHAGIAVWPWEYAWTYHLRQSLVPGVGISVLVLALIGFVAAWRRRAPAERMVAASLLVLYLIVESSPYKPPPNADRYAVVLLPCVCVLAGIAITRIAAAAGRPSVAALLLVGAVGLPAATSVSIVAAMRPDTRDRAREWLDANVCGRAPVILEGALFDGERMTPSYVPDLPSRCQATYVYSLAREHPEIPPGAIVVASSFVYDRFFSLRGASSEMRDYYSDLFARSEELVRFDAGRSSGFHNPTIRILRAR